MLNIFVDFLQEYQIGNKSLVIEDTNIKQAVYIFKCQDSTVQVKGKINSIIVGKWGHLTVCGTLTLISDRSENDKSLPPV